MPGVIALTYDSNTTDSAGLVDLLGSVSEEHGGGLIAQLGLVAHGSEGRVSIGAGDSWDMASLSPRTKWPWIACVASVPDARLDLYSCFVAAGTDGKAFVDQLAAHSEADVYASDDAVGSGTIGGFPAGST